MQDRLSKYTDLNLKSLTLHKGFVEESNMTSMKYWRHERSISAVGETEVLIVDELTFEPRRFSNLSTFIIKKFFEHRHSNLRKIFKP